MIIVKMDNSAVECSIAPAELREIGLTPESFVNGDKRCEQFLAQLNKEMGQQLDYNPESEVLMMSQNVMNDGSIKIFTVKMSNDDIEKAADRIMNAADGLAKQVDPERIREILEKAGSEKGAALSSLISDISGVLSEVYIQEPKEGSAIEAASMPAVDYAVYMVEFVTMEKMSGFCRVVENLPIEESSLYKMDGRYYLMVGLRTKDDKMVYEMRRCGVEYADGLSINTAEELHIEESGTCIIKENAVKQMAGLYA